MLTLLVSMQNCLAQQAEFKSFDANAIYRQLDASSFASQQTTLMPSWWDSHVARSLRDQQPIPTDVHTLLFLAVHNSNQIKIAKRDPLIRETAVQEADSNFDLSLIHI